MAELTEYAIMMPSGAMQVRNPDLERVYPLAEWIEHRQRVDRTTVYRRRIIVVEDWTEVTDNA